MRPNEAPMLPPLAVGLGHIGDTARAGRDFHSRIRSKMTGFGCGNANDRRVGQVVAIWEALRRSHNVAATERAAMAERTAM